MTELQKKITNKNRIIISIDPDDLPHLVFTIPEFPVSTSGNKNLFFAERLRKKRDLNL